METFRTRLKFLLTFVPILWALHTAILVATYYWGEPRQTLLFTGGHILTQVHLLDLLTFPTIMLLYASFPKSIYLRRGLSMEEQAGNAGAFGAIFVGCLAGCISYLGPLPMLIAYGAITSAGVMSMTVAMDAFLCDDGAPDGTPQMAQWSISFAIGVMLTGGLFVGLLVLGMELAVTQAFVAAQPFLTRCFNQRRTSL